MRLTVLKIGAMVLLPVVSMAQGTTVIDTATAGRSSINDALAGPAAEIELSGASLDSDGLVISRSVVLRGSNSASPTTLVLSGTTSQEKLGPGDGIFVCGSGITVSLENLILIPSLDGSLKDDMVVATAQNASSISLTLENVTMTGNDGLGAPVSPPDLVTGLPVGDPAEAGLPDDGIHIVDSRFGGYDGDVDLTLKDVVINGAGFNSPKGDGIVAHVSNGSISFDNVTLVGSSRYGIQIGGRGTVQTVTPAIATDSALVSAFNGRSGIQVFSAASCALSNVRSHGNGYFGIAVQASGVESFALADAFIAENGTEGLMIANTPPQSVTYTVTDTDFANNGQGAPTGHSDRPYANVKLDSTVPDTLVLQLQSSTIRGSSASGFENSGGGRIELINSTVVTSGADALARTLRLDTDTMPDTVPQ